MSTPRPPQRVPTPQVAVGVTAAKTVVAGVGATLTAVQGAVAVILVAINDGQLDGGEIGLLVTTALTLISTVYGVWKVRNEPVRENPFIASQ